MTDGKKKCTQSSTTTPLNSQEEEVMMEVGDHSEVGFRKEVNTEIVQTLQMKIAESASMNRAMIITDMIAEIQAG